MGFYALPEKGEQVLVAFENGDLGQPYVLGSLWNAKARPPVTNADGPATTQRMIKSRAGHTITFDDTGDVGKLVIQDKARQLDHHGRHRRLDHHQPPAATSSSTAQEHDQPRGGGDQDSLSARQDVNIT